MLRNIYGPAEEEDQDFRNYMFCEKAPEHQVALPKIHLIINNRVTSYRTRYTIHFAINSLKININVCQR